jgi:hypothetical protein
MTNLSFKKTAFLLYSLTFLECAKNQSLNDGTLISLNDAQKEYSAVIFLKQVEYYPRDAIYIEFTLEQVDFNCNREIVYDKGDFQLCMKNITLFNFQPKAIDDLISKISLYKNDVCNLKKIILFKDSILKGELNLCEINP